MDIITSMFTIVNNVSDTDRQYKILSKKLQYAIRKADHFFKQKKLDNVPQFVLQNLKHKNSQAKQYLDRINNLLTSQSIPLKQKIKLSLPFNKTNNNVRTVIDQLQRALQDINQYTTSSITELQQKQLVGKRSVKVNSNSESQKEDQKEFKRKIQQNEGKKKISITNEEIDQGLEEQLMGPTIQEDQAIQFTKNKYVTLTIELMGSPQIIQTIKSLNSDLLKINKKELIKFQGAQNYLKLFSLTRLYFKPIYGKLKVIYPDVDRISKTDHFVVLLKRSRQQLKQQPEKKQKSQKTEKQPEQKQGSQKLQNQMFFSFPDQTVAVKQKFQVVIKRATDKSIYCMDMSDNWQKVEQQQKVIVNGDRIATFLSQNKEELPGLYYKIKFTLTQ